MDPPVEQEHTSYVRPWTYKIKTDATLIARGTPRMGWQDGTFRRLYSWTGDAAAGYDIMADRMDADTNDIVGGVNNTLTRDGTNVPLGNLAMGGFKHLGVAQASNPTDYARFDQVVPATGNGTITGNLTVTGALSATGNLSVTGWSYTNGLNNAGGMFLVGGLTTDTLTSNGIHNNSGGLFNAGGLTTDSLSASGGITALGVTAGANGIICNGPLEAIGGGILCYGNNVTGANLIAGQTLQSAGDSYIGGTLHCGGSVIGASLSVTTAVAGASLSVSGTVSGGGLSISGGGVIQGNLVVDAPGSVFQQGLVVNAQTGQADAMQINGGILAITGNPSLACSGDATFSGALTVNGYASLDGGAVVRNGDLNIYGNLYVNGIQVSVP